MLSVIIPTYNESTYLPLLLRSIQAQNHKDFEVIVADAHSTDDTREIAKSFGARVVDGGMPGAGRNRGAAAAQGEVLLFLDADVILPDPWFLQMTVAEFEKRKLGVATCKVKPMSDRKVDKVFHAAFNYFMWVTQATTPHAPGFCIFARKDVHEKLKGFDEEIRFAEDHDYVNRASKISKFGILKTYEIPVSVRRFERDGRLNIAVKYLLSEVYLRTKGNIKDDTFNYTFGHSTKNDGEKKKGFGRWRRARKQK
ncbi:MAG: glycosyltransferase [Patescibacteria group bacterium]|jgi:glycosyltransferase involved in cell wall biosynthesis